MIGPLKELVMKSSFVNQELNRALTILICILNISILYLHKNGPGVAVMSIMDAKRRRRWRKQWVPLTIDFTSLMPSSQQGRRRKKCAEIDK